MKILLILGLALTTIAGNVRDYYSIETIPLPEGESSVDGIDFLPDGRLACCVSLSKVYLYEHPSKSWQLFADGLHTPLGVLAVSDSELLIAQRPEITLLRDSDGDGKADHFKTVTDHFGMSGNYGEWNFGPVRDLAGNLYFGLGTGSTSGRVLTNEVRGIYSPIGHEGRMNSAASYRGWIMRLSKDGVTEPWANGMREPNGLGFDLDGRLYVSDNQGDYVGSSKLFNVRKGHFYGHAPSLAWRDDFHGHPLDTPIEKLDRLRTPAAIVFSHGDMANSPSQPLCDRTNGAFGPFAGQLFIGEMDRPRIIRCMLEEVAGEVQGACTPFFDGGGLLKGNNRLAFHPDDHSLWVGHTLHAPWVGESGLQRIAWTGKTPFEVKSMSLTDDGFRLSFTKPVGAGAEKPESYRFRRYFYNYQGLYGSNKYGLTNVPVTRVAISADRLSVNVQLELKAWHLYGLTLSGVQSQDGDSPMNPWMVYTLNRLRANTPARPAPEPFKKPRWRKPSLPKGGVRSVGGPTRQAFDRGEPTPLRPALEAGALQLPNLSYQAQALANHAGGETFAGSNFIHPLRTPSGFVLTQIQPGDHLHHFGLWWPWKYLAAEGRKINCWELQKGEGLVRTRDVSMVRDGVFVAGSDYLDRTAPDGPKIVLHETLIARVVERQSNGTLIDLSIMHTPAIDSPVEIVKYRYSGFSFRGAASWTKDNSSLLTSAGKQRDDSNGTRATWVRLQGATPAGGSAGLIIMSHPGNHNHPEPLRTWGTKTHNGAIFVNFNSVQTESWTLAPGSTATRRYRLLAYDGEISPDQAEKLWQTYAQ